MVATGKSGSLLHPRPTRRLVNRESARAMPTRVPAVPCFLSETTHGQRVAGLTALRSLPGGACRCDAHRGGVGKVDRAAAIGKERKHTTGAGSDIVLRQTPAASRGKESFRAASGHPDLCAVERRVPTDIGRPSAEGPWIDRNGGRRAHRADEIRQTRTGAKSPSSAPGRTQSSMETVTPHVGLPIFRS